MCVQWEIQKLSEIGTIVGGSTPSTKDSSNYDGEIPWITPKDLSGYRGRYIKRGSRNITRKGYCESSTQLIPAGSVLLSSRAPIGYLAIASTSLCTNQGFKSIVPDETKITSLFLYYSLLNDREKLISLGTGTTFPEISGNTLGLHSISIPDIKIQNNITSILSSIDDKIELNSKINDYLVV